MSGHSTVPARTCSSAGRMAQSGDPTGFPRFTDARGKRESPRPAARGFRTPRTLRTRRTAAAGGRA